MGKYEATLRGDFDQILSAIDEGILAGSVSARLEDGSDIAGGAFRCAVRVYERYSAFGGNRVSLNVTLVTGGDAVILSAITSGGSQAMFFKVNTIGEGTFLDLLYEVVQPFV